MISVDPFATLSELAPLIRSGRISSLSLVEAALDRIGRHDGVLKAFVHLSETARDNARRADAEIKAGQWRGPLHGIPVAIKDNYLTRDMPTRAGTEAKAISFARKDAEVVKRLRDAGAILLGKTRTHEFAWGTVTPPTRNPWDVGRVPGGSSGGSASAVAAGLAVVGIGSDTGGSVRIPASLTGTVGLKPTFGRVGRSGIVPHSWSLDHPGALTRSVADAAAVLEVLAGPDAGDPATARQRPLGHLAAALDAPIAGLRIGVCRNHFFDANQPDVETAVEAAITDLSRLGAKVREFRIPLLDYGLGAIFAIELASSSTYHDRTVREGRTAEFSPDVRLLVEMGRLVSAVDYLKAEQFRRQLMEAFRLVFDEVDAIVVPTTPLTAWRVNEWTVAVGGRPESVLAASWRLTYPFNLTGLPAISLRCGFDRDGLPIGLQIAAKPFDEAMVVRVARAYERTTEWWSRQPPLD
jgi:aspartyl-tRNA(Asn)/glutamyl-tRNA(Gln) amidotransferase subunit A